MKTTTQMLYTSKEAIYELDSRKLFTVIHLLNSYCTDQTNRSAQKGGDWGTTWLQGDGTRLHVEAERRGSGPVRVTLADLVLDLDEKKLTCKVYAHAGLIVNPLPLIEICEGYKVPLVK